MMKTQNPLKHPPHQWQRAITHLVLGLAVGMFSSCGISPAGPRPPDRPVVASERWYLAQDNPPTYFPKGVSKNHPTTYKDGMWVTTGDMAGTQYFIPGRGVDSKALVAEALAAVTPTKRARQASEDWVDHVEGAPTRILEKIFDAGQLSNYPSWGEGSALSDSGYW